MKILRNKKGQLMKGTASYLKGIPLPQHLREKLSRERKGRHFSPLTEFKKGKNHRYWKGNNAGYSAKHKLVRRRLGAPDTCEHCHRSGLKAYQIHWANKSGKYKINLNDWIRLCAKCHVAYDKIRIR